MLFAFACGFLSFEDPTDCNTLTDTDSEKDVVGNVVIYHIEQNPSVVRSKYGGQNDATSANSKSCLPPFAACSIDRIGDSRLNEAHC